METVRKASLTLTASLDLHRCSMRFQGPSTCCLGPRMAYLFIQPRWGRAFGLGPSCRLGERRNWPWKEPRLDGLTYSVARTEEMIVVEDMASHPLYANISGFEGSAVGLPSKSVTV
jgi:hypothetical protein